MGAHKIAALLCASVAAGYERGAGAQPPERQPMEVQPQPGLPMDAACLLQEHAVAATGPRPAPSAWSSKALRQLRRQAESHSAEDAARLFRRGGLFANLTHLSRVERGLMLLEEAGRIFAGRGAAGSAAARRRFPGEGWVKSTLKALEDLLPGHHGFECVGASANALVHLAGGLVTIALTTKCHDSRHCTADSLEVLRFFFVAMQELKGAFSHCLPFTEPQRRCNEGMAELLTNTMGVAGSITELTYKCPEYDGEHYNKTLFGAKVTKIVCTLGLTKGGLYFAMTLSKIFHLYNGIMEDTLDDRGMESAPKLELFSQLSATCAWIAQMVFLSLGTCKEKFGRLPCYAEATEITAYVAQALAGGLSTYSYCKDDDAAKGEAD